MSMFSDPHWAYVAPAYALTVLCFLALAVWSVARLRKWARAAKGSQ